MMWSHTHPNDRTLASRKALVLSRKALGTEQESFGTEQEGSGMSIACVI